MKFKCFVSLVTNWHVFATPAHTHSSGAHFAFEKDDAGVIGGGVVFEIDPQKFFFSDKAHDIAITGGIWKKGMPETDIDWVANEGARRVNATHRRGLRTTSRRRRVSSKTS